MKKIIYAVFILLFFSLSGYANPGDTTWVQANHVNLDYYNNFDTAVTFPDGSKTYRKILMIFTLGEYDCPPGTNYCHQWDYTVQNYLMTPNGDTVELSRLITPYANTGVPRFPSTWEQPYVFDVTDFYPLLQDDATVRIHYSGYSGGFTADIKFAFIEGTPDRNVMGIAPVYDNSARYGDTSDPINDHFPLLSQTAPVGAESAEIKILITGHGNDENGCCEFASHSYDVFVDGSSVAHQAIWRDDCGANQLYPQGGTWIWNRANWCPGDYVNPIYHELTGVTNGSNYTLQMKFPPYSVDTNYGSYTTSAIVFYYGGFNKTLDASLDEIIAPTTNPDHYRENPGNALPSVRVHNSGSTAITSLIFQYGVHDSTLQTYTWTGNIDPLADQVIQLEAVGALTNLSLSNTSGIHQFDVAIMEVNGQADEDPTNDELSTPFKVAPLWPGDIIVDFHTSNFMIIDGALYWQDPNQSWQITDLAGNVVAERINTSANTQYTDTVALPARGFYKFTVTSGNGAGLHFWAFDNINDLVQGSLKIRNLQGDPIVMDKYNYSGYFRDDFGSFYSQNFTVAAPGTSGVADINNDYRLDIYPNPAQDYIHLTITGKKPGSATIQIVNVLGQTVYQTTSNKPTLSIPTSAFANGIYTLTYTTNAGKKVEQIVINR